MRHMMRNLQTSLPKTPWAKALALAALMALGGCGSAPKLDQADQGTSAPTTQVNEAEADGAGAAAPGKLAGQDIATRHALFKVSAFESLPGWKQDNFTEAWAAFKESCKVLERKPNAATWKPLCARVKTIKDAKAARQFMEQEFTLLTVQNTDRSREGDITGYYEPLLQGRAQRDAQFSVPVYGVPNDLYFLDWKTVPVAQRKAVAYVKPNGRLLMPVPAGQSGAIAVDMKRFTLDTLDRRLRVRLQGNEGLPYYTRADINRAGDLDAPVLAWVDDPIALYAMQVQGAGRIRLPDGSVLRVAYADQNGHPFKPMQLASSGNERVQTRGAKVDGGNVADEVEHFDLADALADGAADAPEPMSPTPDPAASTGDEPLTRGARKTTAATAATSPGDPAVSDAVSALLPPAGNARPAAKPAPVPAQPTGASAKGSSQQLVDDLLTQAQTQKGQKGRSGQVAAKAANGGAAKTPAVASVAAAPATAAGLSANLLKQRSQALDSDPSYVFFRPAPDQSTQAGPVGALGVPLTAGRSLAVDPRVLPLGYPVFLDAATGDKRQTQMQRLMFAQDTGGAIRGAVRADYFWGFGADAGRQARRTKNRGRMWVLVPHAEVEALLSSKLVTRGGKADAAQPECLIPDEDVCDSTASSDEDALK